MTHMYEKALPHAAAMRRLPIHPPLEILEEGRLEAEQFLDVAEYRADLFRTEHVSSAQTLGKVTFRHVTQDLHKVPLRID